MLGKNMSHYPAAGVLGILYLYLVSILFDNFFKHFSLLLSVEHNYSYLQGIAVIVYALPYVLFSQYAGFLVDRFDKVYVMRVAKCVELVALLFVYLAFKTESPVYVVLAIFTFSFEGIMLGSAINSIIPIIFSNNHVQRANGGLKFSSTILILVAILTAGFLLDYLMDVEQKYNIIRYDEILFNVFTVMLVLSLLSLFYAFYVPREYTYRYKSLKMRHQIKFPTFGPINTVRAFVTIKDPPLRLAIFMDGFFYALMALYYLVINNYAIGHLGFTDSQATELFIVLSLGLAFSSIIVSRFPNNTINSRYYIPSLVGQAIIIFGLNFLSYQNPDLVFDTLAVLLFICGFMGGFIVIPATAFYQIRPDVNNKGQVLGIVYFVSFASIGVAGVFYSLISSVFSSDYWFIVLFLAIISITLILFIYLRWSLMYEYHRDKARGHTFYWFITKGFKSKKDKSHDNDVN